MIGLRALPTPPALSPQSTNPPPCYSRADQSAAPTDRLHTTQPIAERLPTTPRHCVSWCGPTGLPCAPQLSRPVLHPRCARARAVPTARWLVVSTAPNTPTPPATSPLRGSPIPCYTPPPAYVMPHAEHASRQALRLIPCAMVICNVNGDCTRPKTPAGTATAEQPRSSPPAPPPSPAAPTQATPAELSCPVLNTPALSRLPCGTCTAPSVGAGWVPGHPKTRRRRRARDSTVSSTARLLRVFDRLPTASFQQPITALWAVHPPRRVNSHPQDRLRRSTRDTKATLQNPAVCFARILVAPPATHIAGLIRCEKTDEIGSKALLKQSEGLHHDIDCSVTSLALGYSGLLVIRPMPRPWLPTAQ